MIIRKIIILTVLGGQAIFIAGLLLLIFLSCITQLETREERGGGKLVRKKRQRKERQRGSRRWEWGGSVYVWGRIPGRMCVAESKTDKERQKKRVINRDREYTT